MENSMETSNEMSQEEIEAAIRAAEDRAKEREKSTREALKAIEDAKAEFAASAVADAGTTPPPAEPIPAPATPAGSISNPPEPTPPPLAAPAFATAEPKRPWWARKGKKETAAKTIDVDADRDAEDKKEATAEIKKLSKEDRERLRWGLNRIGYNVEKAKDDFFAFALAGAAKKADKKGTFGRFVRELRESFVRDAKEAEKKGLDIQEERNKSKYRQVGNIGKLAGNTLKYGRFVADVTGASIANPLRYVMASAQISARGFEAGKEARFKSDKLLEKTQIKDVDRAAEEAWRIYTNAGGTRGIEGEGMGVSAEELKNSYLLQMPEDISERLKNPTTALSFIQKVFRFDMQTGLNNINNQINRIENNKKLSPTEKKGAEKIIIEKYKKILVDYDRMLTQYGTVDQLAMGARYAQTASKGVVLGMQIETVLISVEKIWDGLSDLLSKHDWHNLIPGGKGHVPDAGNKTELHNNNMPQDQSGKLPPQTHPVTQPPAPRPENLGNKIPPKPEVPPTSGAAANVPDAKIPAVEVVPAHAEISREFSIKLGTDGVPKNLETVFNEISANHLPLPAGGVVDQAFAAKSLNMAANLVKLTEGHGGAGITADEWAKAANFTNGELQIKDHQAFNDILNKLQEHANQNWDNGTLGGDGAAGAYVPNISHGSWLKVLHAEGLHDTNTGITGHQEITGDKIQDFGPRKIFEERAAGKVFAGDENEQVGKSYEAETNPDSSTSSKDYSPGTEAAHPPKPVASPEPTVAVAREEVLKKFETAEKPASISTSRGLGGANKIFDTNPTGVRSEDLRYGGSEVTSRGEGGVNIVYNTGGQGFGVRDRLQHFVGLTTEQNEILNHHPEFASNHFHLTGERLAQTYQMHEQNLEHVFANNPDRAAAWSQWKDFKASEALGKENLNANNPLIVYLHRLQDVTKLKPEGGIFRRFETVSQYIARALQKAAQMGRLSQVRVE